MGESKLSYTSLFYFCFCYIVRIFFLLARSPVYSHMSSSLGGLTTLRTSRAEKSFIEAFDLHQDAHTRAYFLLIGTTTWLGIRLDCLSAVFLSAVTFCCVLASNSKCNNQRRGLLH